MWKQLECERRITMTGILPTLLTILFIVVMIALFVGIYAWSIKKASLNDGQDLPGIRKFTEKA
jgi:hypothetical protein